MATAPQHIRARTQRASRAEMLVLAASLCIALVFGLVIGRTTAPKPATPSTATTSVLTTAGLTSANGERHLQVMEKMNRLSARR
jgi:hypothetical protein